MFEQIVENEEEENVLQEQLTDFHMKRGLYLMAVAQIDVVTMEPIELWFGNPRTRRGC